MIIYNKVTDKKEKIYRYGIECYASKEHYNFDFPFECFWFKTKSQRDKNLVKIKKENKK